MKDQFILTPFYLDQYSRQLETMSESSWSLNNPSLPEGDSQSRMSILHQSLASLVEETIHSGDRPVSIVGDCCATIGTMAGLQRSGIDPTLIWFDAHGDFNTWETTPSGFLGGMPLAMLVGLGEQRMPQAVDLRSVPEEHVILTDARDLDAGEVVLVQSSSIQHLPDVAHLLDLTLPDRPLYVHFDVDVLDPQEAPAMNYLAAGGPSATQLGEVFDHLAQSRSIVAISLSSWNPAMDTDGSTQKLCMHLFNRLLTHR
jgi:arginase